jgi:hypothetical protein
MRWELSCNNFNGIAHHHADHAATWAVGRGELVSYQVWACHVVEIAHEKNSETFRRKVSWCNIEDNKNLKEKLGKDRHDVHVRGQEVHNLERLSLKLQFNNNNMNLSPNLWTQEATPWKSCNHQTQCALLEQKL